MTILDILKQLLGKKILPNVVKIQYNNKKLLLKSPIQEDVFRFTKEINKITINEDLPLSIEVWHGNLNTGITYVKYFNGIITDKIYIPKFTK